MAKAAIFSRGTVIWKSVMKAGDLQAPLGRWQPYFQTPHWKKWDNKMIYLTVGEGYVGNEVPHAGLCRVPTMWLWYTSRSSNPVANTALGSGCQREDKRENWRQEVDTARMASGWERGKEAGKWRGYGGFHGKERGNSREGGMSCSFYILLGPLLLISKPVTGIQCNLSDIC